MIQSQKIQMKIDEASKKLAALAIERKKLLAEIADAEVEGKNGDTRSLIACNAGIQDRREIIAALTEKLAAALAAEEITELDSKLDALQASTAAGVKTALAALTASEKALTILLEARTEILGSLGPITTSIRSVDSELITYDYCLGSLSASIPAEEQAYRQALAKVQANIAALKTFNPENHRKDTLNRFNEIKSNREETEARAKAALGKRPSADYLADRGSATSASERLARETPPEKVMRYDYSVEARRY